MRNTSPARVAALVALAFVASCAPPPAPAPAPAPAPEPPPPPPPVASVLDAPGAADRVAMAFAEQFGSAEGSRTMTIDPLLDSVTVQQNGVTIRLDAELARAVAGHIPGLTLNRFDLEGAGYSRYFVAGFVAPGDSADTYRVVATVTDRQTGTIIGRASVRFVEPGLGLEPTLYHADSPAIMRDRDIDGLFATATADVGQQADAHYVAQYPTSAILAQAIAKYNAGQIPQAHADFNAAALRPNGQNARTLAGLYLTNLRQQRAREAAIMFGRLADLGVSTKRFAVKMLFRPESSAEFVPGPEHAAVYPMWIRQIARAMQAANACVNIVGHTSRSGTADVNDRISLARAQTVKRLLEAEARLLAPRLTAIGVGYRENLVGTGTDDAIDAIDRRVEFRVVPCR